MAEPLEEGAEVGQQKAPVFEVDEQAEVDRHRESEGQEASPAALGKVSDEQPEAEVEADGGEQQRQVAKLAPRVEPQAG